MRYDSSPNNFPLSPLPLKVGVMFPQLLWERRPCSLVLCSTDVFKDGIGGTHPQQISDRHVHANVGCPPTFVDPLMSGMSPQNVHICLTSHKLSTTCNLSPWFSYEFVVGALTSLFVVLFCLEVVGVIRTAFDNTTCTATINSRAVERLIFLIALLTALIFNA